MHIPAGESSLDTRPIKQKTQDKKTLKNEFHLQHLFILTWALTLSCKRDMGSLLCFITTRYGSFCTAPISSWNFCRDDCLITRVFAEIQNMKLQSMTYLVHISDEIYYPLSYLSTNAINRLTSWFLNQTIRFYDLFELKMYSAPIYFRRICS